jgi:hypothetical protein
VRRKTDAKTAETDSSVPDNFVSFLGPGHSLDRATRDFFEPRFGTDFSHVRVHAGPQAAESAGAINARAYTLGSTVVFGAGEYQPGLEEGRRLLAHELAHVVQQSETAHSAGNADSRAPQANTLQRRHSAFIQRQAGAGAHPRAQTAANNMRAYLGQHILFDFWAGDCRDNNKNNSVDENDPAEANAGDGSHYGRTYPGFKTISGYHCRGGWGGEIFTTAFTTNTSVVYRVCADLVSQAYAAAGIGLHHTRRVHDIVNWFQHNGRCRFWLDAAFSAPRHFLPGDLVCSYDPREHHGHAAIVVAEETGVDRPIVVHLPGQSQQLHYGTYDPTSLSDIRAERWPDIRSIYGIGRYVG